MIRIGLVDDHPVVLAGVCALLQSDPEIEIVGTATTGADALVMLAAEMPDLAVIDISLPDLSGLDLAKMLADRLPAMRLITLTVHEGRAYVRAFLLAGVQGYVLKRSAAENLLTAIRTVASGAVYVDPAFAEKGAALPRAEENCGSLAEDLSPREQAVLKMTANGYSNKEIASRLDVGVKSVETYKARAADKLSLRSRVDIVRYALSQGWLSDD